jgi:hypothetical protein
MGHGKVESFNRYCVTNFIAEVKASRIRTLDQLNEAFVAWIEEEYNQRRHSELGTSPKNRWMKDVSRIHYLEEEKIRVAFLWREVRTADKTAVVRLFNRKYKVCQQLARKKLELRYDPERLDQIEIFVDGAFRQRAKPLQIGANRTPKQLPILKEHHEHTPTDYLGYLTKKHQEKIHIKAAAGQKTDRTSLKTFLAIVSNRIAAQVFDAKLATDFYNTYGPFETKLLETCLDNLLCNHPTNLHLSFYLEYIQHQLIQGQSADQ